MAGVDNFTNATLNTTLLREEVCGVRPVYKYDNNGMNV